VVTGWFPLAERRVRLMLVGRLLLDACAVAKCGLVHGVTAPVRSGRLVACADCKNDRRSVTGPDDDMVRAGGAMDEVPLS
jgi:hypothetical protein